MKVFLLAAGLGRRLLPHTANKPKCLIDIGGKPLLSWHVEKLKSFGIDNLIINLFRSCELIGSYESISSCEFIGPCESIGSYEYIRSYDSLI